VHLLRLAATLGAATLILVGCGTHTATIPVTVTDEDGAPLADVYVQVSGTDTSGTTDSTGTVRLDGFKPGVYQVQAGIDGYYRNDAQVSVASSGDPMPVQIALPYVPPLGVWVYRPKSTEWLVLNIDGDSPFHATVTTYEWHCWGGGWTLNTQDVQLDAEANRILLGGYGSQYVPITGPQTIEGAADPTEGWTRDETGGEVAPDTTSTVEPPGTCNGGSALWDNTSGG
jgi:hypothetical protein